ncbi:MAG: LysR family transcriptional regulator [Paracoccus sp. (in: a-proteobacteria)]|uniref:LysR family transcriptional regulator n=1 Tax=Paracoccus sp. TaxID=267 RepID=UPI0039E3968F
MAEHRMPPLHDIDLKLLRIFRTIVDAGGLSGAQAVLNCSQSTLSTQLAELEARLGFRLCQRGRRGFALTEEGGLLLAALDDLMDAAERFQNRIATISGALKGVLRVGLMDAMQANTAWPVAMVLGAFSRRAPETLVDLTLDAPHLMEDLVTQGKRDCVIGPFPEKRAGLAYRPLFQERHSLYALRDHPITRLARVGVEDLADFALIITAGELRRFPFIRRGGRAAPGNLRPAAKVDQMETHLLLITSGRFIGFLPDYLGMSHPALVRLPTGRNLQYLSPIYLAHQRGEAGIILRGFLKCVDDQPLVEGDLTRGGAVVPLAE